MKETERKIINGQRKGKGERGRRGGQVDQLNTELIFLLVFLLPLLSLIDLRLSFSSSAGVEVQGVYERRK